MKKIVAIAALACLLHTLQAQTQVEGGELRFGFQFSPTVAWMTTNDKDVGPSGALLGAKLGMIGEFYFAENYAFTSGLGFNFNSGGRLLYQKPGSYWVDAETNLLPGLDTLGAGTKLTYRIQYLEIPLGFKMRTREFGYLSYFLEPNLTIGIRTQARGKIDDPSKQGEDEEKYNIRREVNPLNLSWGLMGGGEYSLSESTRLVVGLGFQIGFADVTKDNGTIIDPVLVNGARKEDSKGVSNSIILRIGVLF